MYPLPQELLLKIFKRILVLKQKFIRAMPITPLLIGKGATALCKTPNVPEEEYQYVKSVFSLCGITADVEEKDINAVIAVSGSSPAYIYLFAKAVADYAESGGFNREVAKLLFARLLSERRRHDYRNQS